jgi:translocation and assembly module TamB
MALRHVARLLLALGALAFVALAGLAAWLLGTQHGLDWALERAREAAGPRLVVDGARGALARRLQVERLALRTDAASVEARGISGRISLLNVLTGALRIDRLEVRDLRVAQAENARGNEPAQAPGAIVPPLRILLPGAHIGTFTLERRDAAPLAFSDLRFTYASGAEGHRLRNASGVTPWGRVALEASMEAEAPYEVEASGTLERPEAQVRARAVLHPFSEPRIRALEAGAPDVNLAALDPQLPRTRLDIRVQGAGSADALLAGTLWATNREPGPLDRSLLPVQALETRFAYDGDTLRLPALQAEAASGSVRGSATVRGARRADARVMLEGSDLAAIRSDLRTTVLSGALSLALTQQKQSVSGVIEERSMRIAGDAVREGDALSASLRFWNVDPARIGAYPAGSLNGVASLSGRLGTRRDVAARWTIERSTLAGEAFASRGAARLEGERLRGVDASLRWAKNVLTAKGGFGGGTDRLAWTLSVPQPPVDAFAGRIQARGTAQGTFKDPSLTFEARAAPASVAGRFKADVLSVSGDGRLTDHRVSISARGRDFHLEAALEGGWHGAPGWKGRIVEARNRGRYPLDLLQPVAVAAARERVEVGSVRARLGAGRVALERFAWTPGRIESAGEFAGLPAAWIVGAGGLGERVNATLLLDGRWAISSTPQLDGSLEIRRASGDLAVREPAELALGLQEATLVARFEAGQVRARLDAEAKLGSIHARAEAAGIEAGSALRAEAALQLADLRILAAGLPPQVRVGGRGVVKASAQGTLGDPELAARLDAEALSVHVPPYGIYLSDGVLRASLAGEAVKIEELSLRGGEGRFVASGAVPLANGAQGAALRWTAERLQVLARPDMRLVVSGDGSAALEERRVALAGKLLVINGYLERGLDRLPTLDPDIVVAGSKAQAEPVRNRVPLDLALLVDLGRNFKVREAGFDGLLRGEVHLATAKDGDLRAFGRISAADATYRAYGRTLEVDPGVVIFDGPLRNPGLQIEAWRRNQEVPAGVRVSGTLQQPRVELLSDPPLPEGSKLSWLVLGRAPGEASGADLALLQTAASAMLGRGDSVPITTRIADAVGLDELAVRGSSQMESRVVALGKRLSDRLYLTYEQGVGAAAQNLVKIDLSLTERISLRGQTGTTSGGGIYYRYSWD